MKSSGGISGEAKARECEIIRKGIDGLEKQIKKYISIYVSKDQVDIAFIKKCKTTNIPALNSAMRNIQKSLQRYMGFEGVDSGYCDRIKNLMDKAQAWAMDIEEIYNKAEIHSINTSKGDSLDVGVFSNNSKVTVFEFWNLQSLLTWDGEAVYKRRINCTINTCQRR